MPRKWFVLLEAVGDPASGTIDAGALGKLLGAVDPDPAAGALHRADRYALQVTATGSNPAEALSSTLSRWADVVRQLELPAWEVVRAEVLTPEELDRDLEHHPRETSPALAPPPPDHGDSQDMAQELLRQAFADRLTGLLGPTAFDDRVERAVATAGGRNRTGVVCLDLDAFHRLNDRVGSATGDRVLLTVAERLTAVLRSCDTLTRYGGDCYAVLLDDTTQEAAVAVADRMLEAVRRPLSSGGHELTLSASVGLALSEAGDSAHDVVGNARAALGLAKEAGGGCSVLHTGAIAGPVHRRPELRTEPLRDGLAHLLLMRETAMAASEATTLQQAAQVVLHQFCAHLGCAIGHLWVPSPDSSRNARPTSLWQVANRSAYRAFQEESDRLLVDPTIGLPGLVAKSGRPVWIADLAADQDFLLREQAAAAGLVSAFSFPVRVGSEVVAVLEFFSATRVEPIDSLLDVLVSIGTQLGWVVERQRADEAVECTKRQLRQSEAHLCKVQAMARLGSWHFDLGTGESTWSDEMFTLYGLSAGESPTKFESALVGVHPADRCRAQAALEHLLESGERVSEEIRIVRPDGQIRWIRAAGSAIRGVYGRVIAIDGSAQDITEQKLAEEALCERAHDLAEAHRVARLGSWEHELSTGRLRWSDEMCRLWGSQPGHHPDIDAFLATICPDDQERLLLEVERLRETGEPIDLDFRAVVTDGRQRRFRGAAHLVRDDQGMPFKMFATAQDVTDDSQPEEEAEPATKKREEGITETQRV